MEIIFELEKDNNFDLESISSGNIPILKIEGKKQALNEIPLRLNTREYFSLNIINTDSLINQKNLEDEFGIRSDLNRFFYNQYLFPLDNINNCLFQRWTDILKLRGNFANRYELLIDDISLASTIDAYGNYLGLILPSIWRFNKPANWNNILNLIYEFDITNYEFKGFILFEENLNHIGLIQLSCDENHEVRHITLKLVSDQKISLIQKTEENFSSFNIKDTSIYEIKQLIDSFIKEVWKEKPLNLIYCAWGNNRFEEKFEDIDELEISLKGTEVSKENNTHDTKLLDLIGAQFSSYQELYRDAQIVKIDNQTLPCMLDFDIIGHQEHNFVLIEVKQRLNRNDPTKANEYTKFLGRCLIFRDFIKKCFQDVKIKGYFITTGIINAKNYYEKNIEIKIIKVGNLEDIFNLS